MMPPSQTHLVLVPSYNSGGKLVETVRDARRHWAPVWIVVDGSTDGSDAPLQDLASADPAIEIVRLADNRGKGSAVRAGLLAARRRGFTHALTMDADGQHPAASIPPFMEASRSAPDALVLGVPVFAADAPRLRVQGRRVSNWWANLETAWCGIEDSLFGFRVYPIDDLLAVMSQTRFMRRFDFDPEAAVRLAWRGLPIVNLRAPVRYFAANEGGISHFRYLRDNALLTWMHTRLVMGALARRFLSRGRDGDERSGGRPADPTTRE